MASTHWISSCIFYITLGFLWWISNPGDGSDGGDDGMWTFSKQQIDAGGNR
jgi:hypothetical protein